MKIKKPISWYKKKLWKLVSEYTRRKADGQCFTCATKKHWKQMQAGHCIPRGSCGLFLYFDETNVQCQCFRCNINLGGNGAVFIERIRVEYGSDAVETLIKSQGIITKFTREDYDDLIEEYKLQLKQLDKDGQNGHNTT